jgi:hypothetical protein
MDPLMGALLLLALGAPLGIAGAWFVTGGAMGIARAFQPAPPMEWPHGVQEDDDFHWQWSDPASGDAAAPDAGGAPASVEDLAPGEGPRAEPVRRS